MTDQDLNGKVIVITGASSGFGKGAALAFAEAGAAVILAARRGEMLDELANECVAKGGQALAVPTDVSEKEDVQQLAHAAVAAFERIDVWINNAGQGALGRFEEVPLDDHVQVIKTDLLGTLYGSYFALQQFHQQQSGILINISSVLGKIPSPYYASYAAAKYGVTGLSAALRQEIAENHEDSIHVCTVYPMSHDTPFFDHAANYSGHEVKPIPPLYDPQEVVDTLVRLATKPQDEVIVGNLGKVMVPMHGVTPGLVEGMMAKETQTVLIDHAAPAEDTEGNVHRPTAEGVEVSGGRLKNKRIADVPK